MIPTKRSLRIALLAVLGLAALAAFALWPLGFRKQVRSWWYWRDGAHHGRFQDPEGLAVDSEGRIYVADEKRCQVIVLDSKGRTQLSFRDIDGYPGPVSTGNRMVVTAPGHLIIIGSRDDLVEVRIEGERAKLVRVLVQRGQGRDQLMSPEGIAQDPKARELYVSDEDARRIVIFDAEGRYVRDFPVDQEPEAIHVFEDRVYVTMPKGPWVSCYGRDGAFRFKFGGDRLSLPDFVLVSPDRKLYVTDNKGHKIEVFDLEGRHFFTIGRRGSEPGRFLRPQDLAFDREGNLIVADSDNHRIQVLTPAGAPVRIIE